jgi:hypothetical protein
MKKFIFQSDQFEFSLFMVIDRDLAIHRNAFAIIKIKLCECKRDEDPYSIILIVNALGTSMALLKLTNAFGTSMAVMKLTNAFGTFTLLVPYI